MKHRGRTFWSQLVERFRRSGLTHEAFALQHDVPVGTLRKWIYRLRREHGAEPRWLPVRVSAPPARVPPAAAVGPLEAILPDGLQLRFAAGTEGCFVADVLDRLRRPLC